MTACTPAVAPVVTALVLLFQAPAAVAKVLTFKVGPKPVPCLPTKTFGGNIDRCVLESCPSEVTGCLADVDCIPRGRAALFNPAVTTAEIAADPARRNQPYVTTIRCAADACCDPPVLEELGEALGIARARPMSCNRSQFVDESAFWACALQWVSETGAAALDLSECCQQQPEHRLTFIPSNLTLASTLELLDLSNQDLSVAGFPDRAAFSALGRLATLRIHRNPRLTELPAGVRALSKTLETLELNENLGLAETPVWLSEFERLQSISVRVNQEYPAVRRRLAAGLAGPPFVVPPNSWPLSLRVFEAAGRGVRSPAPADALNNGSGCAILSLRLAGNQMTALPGWMTGCRALSVVNVAENQLRGDLTLDGTRFPAMVHYNTAHNRIENVVLGPGKLPSLETLNVENNKLSHFPAGIEHAAALTTLHLQDNSIGQVPEPIGTLKKLVQLDLRLNRIAKLPDQICDLDALNLLWLDSNRLTRLPSCIGALGDTLTSLRLSRNSIAELPDSARDFKVLEELLLSHNDLRVIPSSLTDLVSAQGATVLLDHNPSVCSVSWHVAWGKASRAGDRSADATRVEPRLLCDCAPEYVGITDCTPITAFATPRLYTSLRSGERLDPAGSGVIRLPPVEDRVHSKSVGGLGEVLITYTDSNGNESTPMLSFECRGPDCRLPAVANLSYEAGRSFNVRDTLDSPAQFEAPFLIRAEGGPRDSANRSDAGDADTPASSYHPFTLPAQIVRSAFDQQLVEQSAPAAPTIAIGAEAGAVEHIRIPIEGLENEVTPPAGGPGRSGQVVLPLGVPVRGNIGIPTDIRFKLVNDTCAGRVAVSQLVAEVVGADDRVWDVVLKSEVGGGDKCSATFVAVEFFTGEELAIAVLDVNITDCYAGDAYGGAATCGEHGRCAGDPNPHDGTFECVCDVTHQGARCQEARPKDTDIPKFGPDGRDCAHGIRVDTMGYDQKFSCDCTATKYAGPNCDELDEAQIVGKNDAESNAGWIVAVAVAAAFAATLAVTTAAYRFRDRRIRMRAFDFQAEIERMLESNELSRDQLDSAESAEHDSRTRAESLDPTPVELRRSDLTLIERIGAGNFGEVWKALLDSRTRGGLRANETVAVKTTRSRASAEAKQDLMREATVMALVGSHRNLVSIIGTVTKGEPAMLVVSYCELGSLLHVLRAHGPLGEYEQREPGAVQASPALPLTADVKLGLAIDASLGMRYLARRRFVHRDLAARNVLVSAGFVGQVADFGLSRQAKSSSQSGVDSDQSDLYYRAATGVFAVRWTAPEALEALRFSIETDVWSFGILLIEIMQDGQKPYPEISTNEGVMQKVLAGYQHARPSGCSKAVYEFCRSCLSHDPAMRPGFEAICARLEDLRDSPYENVVPVGLAQSSSLRQSSTGSSRDFPRVSQQYDFPRVSQQHGSSAEELDYGVLYRNIARFGVLEGDNISSFYSDQLQSFQSVQPYYRNICELSHRSGNSASDTISNVELESDRDVQGGALADYGRASVESVDACHLMPSDDAYTRMSRIHHTIADRNAYSELKSNPALRTRFAVVLEAMASHDKAYSDIFNGWQATSEGQSAFSELDDAHATVLDRIKLQFCPGRGEDRLTPPPLSTLSQPNPFAPEQIQPTSKRYLRRVLGTFEEKRRDGSLFEACTTIAAELGVEWKQGPLKKEHRVIEKVLLKDGRFDMIFDYARGSFIVDDLADLARVVARLGSLAATAGGSVVRAKNRFAHDYDARESCGYRDYQALLRFDDGWIAEVQVVPRMIFTVKSVLGASAIIPEAGAAGSLEVPIAGHTAYKEYRAVNEARARLQRGAVGASGAGVGVLDPTAGGGAIGLGSGDSDMSAEFRESEV